jgi:hypothetical protein
LKYEAELTAQAIRWALKLGVLTVADLWTDRCRVPGRLNASPDGELQAQLRAGLPHRCLVMKTSPHFPWASCARSIRRCWSMALCIHVCLDPAFAVAKAYLEQNAGKWPMRVIQ